MMMPKRTPSPLVGSLRKTTRAVLEALEHENDPDDDVRAEARTFLAYYTHPLTDEKTSTNPVARKPRPPKYIPRAGVALSRTQRAILAVVACALRPDERAVVEELLHARARLDVVLATLEALPHARAAVLEALRKRLSLGESVDQHAKLEMPSKPIVAEMDRAQDGATAVGCAQESLELGDLDVVSDVGEARTQPSVGTTSVGHREKCTS